MSTPSSPSKQRSAKAAVPVIVTIVGQQASFQPPGAVHVPGVTDGGSVNFLASAACTVHFSNSQVFDTSDLPLTPGDNPTSVKVNNGSTSYCVVGYSGPAGCNAATTGMATPKVMGNPNEIVVP